MEIVRPRARFAPSGWHSTVTLASTDSEHSQRDDFEYVDSYSRGYTIGKHDGTLAGLFVGAVVGVVAAIVLVTLI